MERRIDLEIPVLEFQFYDVISRKMMVEEGGYQIYVGSSSEDCRQSVVVQIPGQKPGVRRMEERTAADHYDEYENIYLTEGEFGYTAAAVSEKGRDGSLVYRDCKILPEQKYVILHLMSGGEGKIEVRIDGKKAAAFQGKTGIYRDIRLEMDCDLRKLQETAEVEMRLNHDVKLCYFRME